MTKIKKVGVHWNNDNTSQFILIFKVEINLLRKISF